MSDRSGDRDDDRSGDRLEPDPERVEVLRSVAGEIRGDSSESEQLAAIVYRLSDLYDADEETTPEEIYTAVRHIVRVKERGTLARDVD